MNPATVTDNPHFGEKVKCFGKQAALCAEKTWLQKQNNLATINIEVAPRQGESVNWQNKITIQLSDRELPELCAVLMGYLPSIHVQRPGKGVEIIRQSQKLFIRASAGAGRLYVLPVCIGDTFRFSALLLKVLKEQCGLSDETMLLAALRGAATLNRV